MAAILDGLGVAVHRRFLRVGLSCYYYTIPEEISQEKIGKEGFDEVLCTKSEVISRKSEVPKPLSLYNLLHVSIKGTSSEESLYLLDSEYVVRRQTEERQRPYRRKPILTSDFRLMTSHSSGVSSTNFNLP